MRGLYLKNIVQDKLGLWTLGSKVQCLQVNILELISKIQTSALPRIAVVPHLSYTASLFLGFLVCKMDKIVCHTQKDAVTSSMWSTWHIVINWSMKLLFLVIVEVQILHEKEYIKKM